MPDIFDKKIIIPMSLTSQEKPFNSEDYIFELKLDGIRALAYLDKSRSVITNSRAKDVTKTFPELQNIHKQARERCILDGEIICTDDKGYPSFNILMQRALLKDELSIKLKSKQFPVSFVAYDILYYKNKETTNLQLLERKKLLNKNLIENDFLSISRYIENDGISFFEKVKSENLEGIVAKLKSGTYLIGKRSSNWIKIKNIIDEDFVIVGYTKNENDRIEDLILGQYDKEKLVSAGKIYLAQKKLEQAYILKFAKTNSLKKPLFNDIQEKVFWIKPKLVCTVSYLLRTKTGNMRQPFFKAIREDKNPKNCKIKSQP